MSPFNLLQESKLQAKLAGPIIVGQVGQNLINLADTIMVGALGAVTLSASAFAGSVFAVAFIAAIGILTPTTSLIAKMQGQEDYPAGGVLLRHSFLVSLGVSAFMIAVLLGLLPFLKYFGQTPEVIAEGRHFYQILTWSLLPALIYQCYKQFADGIGKTKIGMGVMLFGVLLNIGANYVLIYGKWGAPALGLDGAGYATLGSRIVMAILMIILVHTLPLFKKYFATHSPHTWDRHLFRTMLRLGLPNGLTHIFEVGAFSATAIMMGWFGALPLAAHQITISLASTTFMVSVGIGIASSIRVAFEQGRGDRERARFAGFTSIKVGAIYSLVCAVVILVTRQYLPRLFVKDVDVIDLAADLFIVVGFFQLFDSIQAIAVGALRGLNDTAWPSLLAFISYWLVGLPCGYALAFYLGLGPIGVWVGLLIGLLVASALLTGRFHRLSNFLIGR